MGDETVVFSYSFEQTKLDITAVKILFCNKPSFQKVTTLTPYALITFEMINRLQCIWLSEITEMKQTKDFLSLKDSWSVQVVT
jgi:hypothetical protein